MKFIWDAKYSVNIKSIDSQHQRFFEICNEIGYLVHQHQTNPQSITQVIKEFIDYSETHLSYEEKYFKEFDYPDKDFHISEHDSYRLKITSYQASLSQPNVNIFKIANELADFARDWLSDHILAVDHKYSQFFIAHDIK